MSQRIRGPDLGVSNLLSLKAKQMWKAQPTESAVILTQFNSHVSSCFIMFHHVYLYFLVFERPFHGLFAVDFRVPKRIPFFNDLNATRICAGETTRPGVQLLGLRNALGEIYLLLRKVATA